MISRCTTTSRCYPFSWEKRRSVPTRDVHNTELIRLALQKVPHASYEVHTPKELDTLLKDPEFNTPDRIRLIEIFMPR